MRLARLGKIGARRPIGTALSPGRRAGLGGTRAAPHAACFWLVLPVHRQLDGSRGPEPGSFPAHLPHAPKLSARLRSVSDVVDQRDAQFAGGPLSANASRSNHGFDRGRHAPARTEAILGENAGPAGASGGIERAIAARVGATLAG